jgi:hypothetical protein
MVTENLKNTCRTVIDPTLFCRQGSQPSSQLKCFLYIFLEWLKHSTQTHFSLNTITRYITDTEVGIRRFRRIYSQSAENVWLWRGKTGSVMCADKRYVCYKEQHPSASQQNIANYFSLVRSNPPSAYFLSAEKSRFNLLQPPFNANISLLDKVRRSNGVSL